MNNGVKVLLHYRRHCLEMMPQLQVKGDLGGIQNHIIVRLVVREDRVEISETEKIKLRKLANKASRILRRNFTFLDITKTS